MLSFRKNILFIFIFLFQGSIFGFAQADIDSLQRILNKLDKTQTDSIVEISKRIIENSDSELVKYNALGTIINAYSLKNERKKALPYLSEAKKIAEEMSDPQMKSKAYLTMSSLYTSIGLTQQAHLYLQKSISIIKKLPESESKSELTAFIDLESGNLFHSENKFDSAHYFYKKSLLNFDQIIQNQKNNSEGLNPFYKYATYGFGKTLLDLDKIDSSEIYLNIALNISNDLDPGLDFHVKKELSLIYTSRKQYNRAIDTLKTILNHPNFDQLELEAEIYKNLTGNYKALGDEQKYIYYNEKYLQLNSKISQNNISTINKVFENQKSESSGSNFYWIIAVIFIGLMISGFILFKFYQSKRKLNSEASKIEEKELRQPEKIVLPIEVEKNILKGLNEFEMNKGFTNKKLNISNLANQLETNTTYLSEVIKRQKGKNFSNYINELRIEFICAEIDSKPEYKNYKISYLAEICGFNSHSFFATVFKNVTGISPSEYLENSSKSN